MRILKSDKYISQLRKKFKSRKEIEKRELRDFLKALNPDLQPVSRDRKIYEWMKTGILREIASGVYQLEAGEKSEYIPTISPALNKLNRIIKKEFPLIDYCIWETRWLTNFMHHIPDTNLVIIEVGDDAQEFVFNLLLKGNRSNLPAGRHGVFLNPSIKELNQKVWNSKESIIIKNLVSRAPVKKTDQICLPKLEKILVDLFCEADLFAPFQESELDQIFHYASEFYIINWKTAAYYTDRRGKTKEFIAYLQELNILPKATLTKIE